MFDAEKINDEFLIDNVLLSRYESTIRHKRENPAAYREFLTGKMFILTGYVSLDFNAPEVQTCTPLFQLDGRSMIEDFDMELLRSEHCYLQKPTKSKTRFWP